MPDGTTFRGKWVNNMKQGEFMVTHLDGKSEKLKFKNNK